MKHKLKKEIVEWALIIGVIGVVYLGGWHSEVIGRMQQAMLSTGVIQPKVEENGKQMSYSFTLEDLDGNQVNFESFKGEVFLSTSGLLGAHHALLKCLTFIVCMNLRKKKSSLS